MNLLFLMLVFKEEAVRLHDVASHASNAWMTGVSRALIASGVNLRTVGHEPARVWPLGRHLLPGDPGHLREACPQQLVRFLNMPLLRHFFLCLGYRRAVCAAVRESGEAVVCTYNPLLWQVYAAQAAVRKGARWISFVLDDDGVARHGWSRYLKQTRMAAGHVFVSQWAYEQAPVRNKLLMEGGVEAWRGDKEDRRSRVPSVMYAGLFSRSAGMDELLALIDATARQDVEFWICGRGICPELSRRAAQDQRIKLLGFLSEEALDQRLRSAWVLVNPRSVTHEESLMNFPSKLLRYLSYGKPVVTVWTPGIPAEYREVLQVTDPGACGSEPAAIGQAMARQVEGVLQWGDAQRLAWQDKIQQFVVPGKLWASQGERLIEFLKSLDLSTN